MVFGADVDMAVQLTLVETEPVHTEPAQLLATLRYTPEEPYAVMVVFPFSNVIRT